MTETTSKTTTTTTTSAFVEGLSNNNHDNVGSSSSFTKQQKQQEKLPLTMKAIQGLGYGSINEMICVQENVRVPSLYNIDDLPDNNKNINDHMIIKTLAIALAPGDCRVLSGDTKELQGPSKFPYIPGGDCCGIVMELPPNPPKDLPFTIGDIVGCGFMDGKPMGAGSQYSIVNINNAEKVPDGILPIHAAGFVSSCCATTFSDKQYVKKGDRVLIIGATSGIGSILCQLVRNVNHASYVVGVTSHPNELQSLKVCHDIIDYAKDDVYTMDKYITNKFDVIIDLAGYSYQRLEDMIQKKQSIIIKSANHGGRFYTTVPPIGPIFAIHSYWEAIKIFMLSILFKAVKSRLPFCSTRSVLPTYTMTMLLTFQRSAITKLFQYVQNGTVKPLISGPYPFTTIGVQEAFHIQKNRHAIGKVIIEISNNH